VRVSCAAITHNLSKMDAVANLKNKQRDYRAAILHRVLAADGSNRNVLSST
jgi:hypothetical protein